MTQATIMDEMSTIINIFLVEQCQINSGQSQFDH